MKQLKLQIKGMSCHSCETLISDYLDERDGITSVEVSRKKNAAVVDFDENRIDENTIISTIRKLGFEVG